MPKNAVDTGLVSWEIFDALYESQADFCRKLGFLVKSGRATKEEGLALDIISDQLYFKEKEIISLREQALIQSRSTKELVDRDRDGRTNIKDADSETINIIEKLESIRQGDGYPWEYVKSIIDGTYLSMQKKTEQQ